MVPSLVAVTASTIRPLPGFGRFGSRVHRSPARPNARAAPLLTPSILTVVTRNLLPVQLAETAPRDGSVPICCHRPVAGFHVTVTPVPGETSMSRPPPHAATGAAPKSLEGAQSFGGAAITAQRLVLGLYVAAAGRQCGHPGSTTTRSRPSHTDRGLQSRIGAAGILSHRRGQAAEPRDLRGHGSRRHRADRS